MSCIRDKVCKYFRDRDGVTVVEYGVLIALIVAVSLSVILLLGDQIGYLFCLLAAKIGGTGAACLPP